MQGFKIGNRALLGIVIIMIGVIYLLGSLGIVDNREIFSTYWPLILILVGIINLINRSSGNYIGFILIPLGIFYQLKTLDIIHLDINIWEIFWPVIIVLIGIWFIIPKKNHTSSEDTLHSFALFSGAKIVNVSSIFKGGDLTAVFGGLDVDLRGTDITTTEPVVIDALVAFGGIDFKVPDDWRVEIKGIPIFGGWDNKKGYPKNDVSSSKVLTIKCFIIFGGLDVK